MKYEDICTKKVYEVNGEQKVKWLKVGTLKLADNGKKFIELNIFPDTPLFVFEQKDRNAPTQQRTNNTSQGNTMYDNLEPDENLDLI